FHLSVPLSVDPYPVDWLDGAITMYTAGALERIDWIAEEYFLYFEDVDTGWRLARAGWRNLIAPAALAYQEPGSHPTYLGMRNMALFSKKAGISMPKSFGAALRRAFRVSVGHLRRGQSPQLLDAGRGWRDGRAGISGVPSETPSVSASTTE
ncbi:MAG: glycosyltransferase family 2 protein, partial [Leucobacter sp.]